MSKITSNCQVKRRIGPALVLTLFCMVLAPLFLKADALHLSEDEARKSIVSKTAPVYPMIAKQMNLTGRVVVDLEVGEDGSVEKADIVSGNPVLGGAAAAAGKKWKFQPFSADGKPTKAVVRISFDFSR